jgi:Tfp pilus assembly protein PilF
MNKRQRSSRRNTTAIKIDGATLSSAEKSQHLALWLAMLLVVLNVAIYFPVSQHAFVDYDDKQYVVENPHVADGLTWENFAWAFRSGYAANWHPLTWLSHMLDVSLFGVNAGPQHIVNLMLHIAATLCLFVVFHRATGALGRSAFVAALFAAHPLHVESVAWIAERKDVLSALLWMITLWTYVNYVRETTWSRYCILIACYALGLMAKPMLVTLPFVLLLLDLWPLRRPLNIREKVPMFAMAGMSSVVTFFVQRASGAVVHLDFIPLSLRVGSAVGAYLAYIGQMFLPARLAVFYPLPHSVSMLTLAVGLLALAALTVVTILMMRTRPYLTVGWLWYVGTLVPVIGLVQVGVQSRADRYTYIPFIGLFVAIAWGMPELVDRLSLPKSILPAAAVASVLACGVIAHAQLRHWTNSTTLWTHTLDVTNENYFAHASLGYVLWTEGKLDEAIVHYKEALRIRPVFAEAHNNFGVALARQGHLDEAVGEFLEAVRIEPGFKDAQNNLNATQAKLKERKDAITPYAEAVRLNPDSVEAHNNLGAAFAQQDRIDEAIREFTEALRIVPGNPDLLFNIAIMFQRKGQKDQAIQHLKSALSANPQHEDARRALDELMR